MAPFRWTAIGRDGLMVFFLLTQFLDVSHKFSFSVHEKG